MPLWLHVLACVLVPAVWGLAMVGVLGAVDRRRISRQRRDEPPPIDYLI